MVLAEKAEVVEGIVHPMLDGVQLSLSDLVNSLVVILDAALLLQKQIHSLWKMLSSNLILPRSWLPILPWPHRSMS